MSAIVWLTMGVSALSGLLLVNDWYAAHRFSRVQRRPALWTGATAPAWALEELQFVRSAELLFPDQATYRAACSAGGPSPRGSMAAA